MSEANPADAVSAAEAEGSATPAPVEPLFRVVRGTPTDVELAALSVVLAARSRPVEEPAAPPQGPTAWAASARGVVVGVSTATTGPQLFRGAMEGVAVSYRRITDQLRTTAANPERIVASGRVIQDLPGWLQVLADALGTPVEPVTIKRATLRGTALHALEVLAPEVQLVSDTGGQAKAPLRIIAGTDKVSRFFLAIAQLPVPDQRLELADINGVPGVIAFSGDEPKYVAVLDIREGRVASIKLTANPDKLTGVATTAGALA